MAQTIYDKPARALLKDMFSDWVAAAHARTVPPLRESRDQSLWLASDGIGKRS